MSKVELVDLPTMDREVRERAFNYRTGRGGRRSHTRSLVGGGGGGTPLTIISSVPVLQWIRGDLGITQVTGVSAWNDQSTNAYHFTQGTGSKQPLYTAVDATLNNQATVTGDGTDDALDNAAMPNGSSNWFSGIIKVITWSAGRAVWGKNSVAPECGNLYMATGSPSLALYNGNPVSDLNGGLPVGTWGRAEMHLINSAAAYLKLRTTVVTGDAGGLSATGCSLFAAGGGTFGAAAIAERVVCPGKPTQPEIDALDAYYTARYGVGLV